MTIDIIATAREAGFVLEGDISGAGRLPALLERFAALVRAQVIEEAAQKCSVLAQERETDYVTNFDCADALRSMKSDSGHSTARAGEASTWQPFDTAPRDGTIFLAMNHDREAWVATYITKEGPPRLAYRTNGRRESKRYRIHEIDGKRLMEELESSESWDSAWTYWSRGYEFKPTHWTPLPDAAHRRSLASDQKPNVQAESASPSVLLIRGEK